MTLLVSDQEVRSLFVMKDAMKSMSGYLETLARGSAVQMPRVQIDTDRGWLRIQSGLLQEMGCMGFKAYTVTKGYGPRYAVFLYSTETGALDAIIDADSLTSIRTGALTGIATGLLCRGAPKVMGLFGSGRQARAAAEAIQLAKGVGTAVVFSPNRQHRSGFAAALVKELGLDAKAVDDPSLAARQCDIITTASSNRTMTPILQDRWIDDGAHVNAIGAVGRGRVEVGTAVLSRSALVVVDSVEECMRSSEEIISAIEAEAIAKEDLIELSSVFDGRSGRRAESDVTLFKSQGSGTQDVFAARRVFELASKHGVGKQIGEVAPSLRLSPG